MAKNDIECVSVYFKYRMWETSDFDDFEMDNDLERVFGDSVKWFDKDMEPEAFNHAVSRVQGVPRDTPSIHAFSTARLRWARASSRVLRPIASNMPFAVARPPAHHPSQLHHVNDHLRAEARGEVPSEEALTAHQERYLHVFRLGMFGEEKTIAMAKEDARIVAERTAREAEKAAAAERA